MPVKTGGTDSGTETSLLTTLKSSDTRNNSIIFVKIRVCVSDELCALSFSLVLDVTSIYYNIEYKCGNNIA